MGKGAGQQNREGRGEGAESAWAPCSALWTLSESDKVISFWHHMAISERKGEALELGRWTSRSLKHLLQALQSCRNTLALGVHTRMPTNTQSCFHVFKQPSHMLTHPHSYAITCVPINIHVSTIWVQIPGKQTLSWQPACRGLVGRALRSNPCKGAGSSRGRS